VHQAINGLAASLRLPGTGGQMVQLNRYEMEERERRQSGEVWSYEPVQACPARVMSKSSRPFTLMVLRGEFGA
jgi:hypothetical protein